MIEFNRDNISLDVGRRTSTLVYTESGLRDAMQTSTDFTTIARGTVETGIGEDNFDIESIVKKLGIDIRKLNNGGYILKFENREDIKFNLEKGEIFTARKDAGLSYGNDGMYSVWNIDFRD